MEVDTNDILRLLRYVSFVASQNVDIISSAVYILQQYRSHPRGVVLFKSGESSSSNSTNCYS